MCVNTMRSACYAASVMCGFHWMPMTTSRRLKPGIIIEPHAAKRHLALRMTCHNFMSLTLDWQGFLRTSPRDTSINSVTRKRLLPPSAPSHAGPTSPEAPNISQQSFDPQLQLIAPPTFYALHPVDYSPVNDSRRRNAEHRAQTLRADPLIGKVEPNRVFCTMCQKWVQLRQDSSYCAYPWLQHRGKCMARQYVVISCFEEHPHFLILRVDNADLKKPRSLPKGRRGSLLVGTMKNTSRMAIEAQNALNRKMKWISESRKGISEGTMWQTWNPMRWLRLWGYSDRGLPLTRAPPWLEIGRMTVSWLAIFILVGPLRLVLQEPHKRTIRIIG